MTEEEFVFFGNQNIAKGDDKVKVFLYAHIGFFIEVAQMLEFNIRKLLCYEQSVKEIAEGNIDKNRVTSICEKYDKYYIGTYNDKLTLGRLINKLDKECKIDNNITKTLRDINDFRTKIVHSIFQNNVISNNLEDVELVKEYVLKRILPMIDETITINKKIIEIINKYKYELKNYKQQVGIN